MVSNGNKIKSTHIPDHPPAIVDSKLINYT